MHTNEHYELLNPRNGLVACPITSTTAPSLVEGSLNLTTKLFPSEPEARERLKTVYEGLSRNEGRVEDFEALHYHAYAMPRNEDLEVVGVSGLYRLLTLDEEAMAMASTVRNFLVSMSSKGASLVDARLDIQGLLTALVWGGRMAISPTVSRSPSVSPFIFDHILSTALSTIERLGLPPVLLLFTRRDDNHALLRLYEGMGFLHTGGEVMYLNHAQVVLALHLHKDAPVMHRLIECKKRALRHGF